MLGAGSQALRQHLITNSAYRSDLDYTILRPGRLTDDPGIGKVATGDDPSVSTIPREDVAALDER
ncbi:UNVERIFIED_CONTAM: uncharacterized protein YbjT (DUF2867 family) [Paenibacillus sp. PvR008]